MNWEIVFKGMNAAYFMEPEYQKFKKKIVCVEHLGKQHFNNFVIVIISLFKLSLFIYLKFVAQLEEIQ